MPLIFKNLPDNYICLLFTKLCEKIVQASKFKKVGISMLFSIDYIFV